MRVGKSIEKVLVDILKMEPKDNKYVGGFKNNITGELETVRCFEDLDNFGFSCLSFKFDGSPEIYTIDQILEAFDKNYFVPLGNSKVVQFCLELKVPHILDNEIEDIVNEALDNKQLYLGDGVEVVGFNRVTSWVSEEYFKGRMN